MQLFATNAAPTNHAAAAASAPRVIASQTINMAAKRVGEGMTFRETERQYRLAGARDGIGVYMSAADAIAAARQLSSANMPGLAVMAWRGGYRLHDVHTGSKTWQSRSTHTPSGNPATRLVHSSSVPFAAGNLRFDTANARPAVVRDADLVALVDGGRTFIASAQSWAGQQQLVEVRDPAAA